MTTGTDFDHNDTKLTREETLAHYQQMLAECPVAHSSRYDAYYVAGYEEVREVVGAPERFISGEGIYITPSGLPPIPALEFDGEEHVRWRKLMNEPLAASAVKRREPRLREMVNDVIDEFAADGHADLVPQFTDQIPAIAIGEILGLDRDASMEMRRVAMRAFETIATPEFGPAMGDFLAFCDEQLSMRRAHPRGDYLTELASGRFRGVDVSDEESAGLMVAYFFGGNHSTATALAEIFHHVLGVPGLGVRLVADRAALDRAIEESLRLTTPLHMFARTVRGACELGGRSLHDGQKVAVIYAAANRDPRAFDDPDQFHPERRDNPHLAFGHGRHLCPGRMLARAEMRIAVEELLRRVPDIHLSGEVAHSPLVGGGTMIATVSLPVTFTPDTRS